MSKAGVLCYSNKYQNIGDYIQSLAANQFMKSHTYVDRESLDRYSGEQIKIIMNGWFMHKPKHFPPSSKIKSLFISFHMAPAAQNKMLSPEGMEYLMRHGPIGCRDKDTLDVLLKNKIPAYYSGCLTLTLGKSYSSYRRTDTVYIVDPYVDLKISNVITNLLKNFSTIFKNRHNINIIYKKTKDYCYVFGRNSLLKWIQASLIYITYSSLLDKDILLNAEYISHYIYSKDYSDEQTKFEYAEELLKKYSEASLVITSRIHCALPCLGLGTPCIFIESSNNSSGRYNGLTNLLNVIEYISPSNFIRKNDIIPTDMKINKNTKVISKNNHIDMLESLTKICGDFADSD